MDFLKSDTKSAHADLWCSGTIFAKGALEAPLALALGEHVHTTKGKWERDQRDAGT